MRSNFYRLHQAAKNAAPARFWTNFSEVLLNVEFEDRYDSNNVFLTFKVNKDRQKKFLKYFHHQFDINPPVESQDDSLTFTLSEKDTKRILKRIDVLAEMHGESRILQCLGKLAGIAPDAKWEEAKRRKYFHVLENNCYCFILSIPFLSKDITDLKSRGEAAKHLTTLLFNEESDFRVNTLKHSPIGNILDTSLTHLADVDFSTVLIVTFYKSPMNPLDDKGYFYQAERQALEVLKKIPLLQQQHAEEIRKRMELVDELKNVPKDLKNIVFDYLTTKPKR